MAQITKKVLAQEFRRKGLSISEIAEKLGMQRSGSISKWCCDISLTPEQIERLEKKQKSGSYKGRMKFLERLRKTRIEEVALFRKQGIKEICQISDNKFSLQVKINKIHKDRIQEVENYWSKLTGVSLTQFNKTVLIKSKSKKIYPNHNNYYGTLRITIRRGTQLRRKIHGWIEGLNIGIA